ncbi:MAG: hypothetical protein K2H64_03135 [Desulfovibrio sp.]|nr:hypothetical protein [Desulfovibrio sp.]
MLIIFASVAAIIVLAVFIRKAVKNTPFEHKCPCAPHVDHLKRIEDADPAYEKYKKENLW